MDEGSEVIKVALEAEDNWLRKWIFESGRRTARPSMDKETNL